MLFDGAIELRAGLRLRDIRLKAGKEAKHLIASFIQWARNIKESRAESDFFWLPNKLAKLLGESL